VTGRLSERRRPWCGIKDKFIATGLTKNKKLPYDALLPTSTYQFSSPRESYSREQSFDSMSCFHTGLYSSTGGDAHTIGFFRWFGETCYRPPSSVWRMLIPTTTWFREPEFGSRTSRHEQEFCLFSESSWTAVGRNSIMFNEHWVLQQK